jgi:hypothetical protein
MGFLKRLFGGEPARDPEEDAGLAAESVADEQARERELLRAEADRLDDDLIQRQLRYQQHSWKPPAQGGPRRADDEDAEAR